MPLDIVRNTLWELDTEKVAPEVAQELLRQAELRQAAIFEASLGMDQRAAVLAAGFIAAAGALAAAGLAIGPSSHSLMAAAFAGSLLVAAAAGLCTWACRPQRFRFPGVEPMDWAADPNYLSHTLQELRLARAAQLQDYMVENERQQARNGRALLAGTLIAAVAPLFAVLTFWAWSVAS